MKKQLRTSPAARAAAVLLVLALGTAGFWASLFTLSQWDNIWTELGYYNSRGYSSNLYTRTMQARELARLLQDRQWDGGKLSYTDQRRLEFLQADLAADQTNFRFRLLDNDTGALIYSNLPGDASKDALSAAVHSVVFTTLRLERNTGVQGDDYFTWDGERDWYQVHIYLPNWETIICTPENAETAAKYGWFVRDGERWEYDSAQDSRSLSRELALEYGVLDHMVIQDEFLEGLLNYNEYAQYLPLIALLALGLDVAAGLLFVFLCLGAGRRRDREGIVLRLFDRIPLDVLAVSEFFALAVLLNGIDSMTYALNNGLDSAEIFVGLGVISLGAAICLLALLLSLVVRIKAGTVFSNTVLHRLSRAVVRACRRMVASWPLTGRIVGLFLLYLLGTVLTTATVFLIPLYQGLVLYFLCRWAIQWKTVRAGTAAIVGGQPEHRIDTRKMYHDLREHAEQLNDLGSAVSTAVEDRLRSERFKTELITNVSHDLKTPLTSIINYVDLLKKEDIANPKAQEYLEVLDRKSQRLKKLTEDLVEASKASTGALAVSRERLGVVQLLQQALGEFEDKFSQHRLEPVLTVQDGEVYVEADGRHLWRVIDNLLSNCNKYALEGTRVYVDVLRWEGRVSLMVKNISKQQLNIPAEQLMERFVRGEESRTTEGSGLGLSIARSLTELQGGTFHLDIDGDLFKATVSFPEAPPPPALPDII